MRRQEAIPGCARRWCRQRGQPCATKGYLAAQQAILAVAHSLVVIVFPMLHEKQPYRELGADYFQGYDQAKAQARYVKRLEHLGFTVTLTPKEAA